MARLVIKIEADVTGVSRHKLLNDLEEDFRQAVDEAVECGSYYLTDVETDKEYELEVSVERVTLETP